MVNEIPYTKGRLSRIEKLIVRYKGPLLYVLAICLVILYEQGYVIAYTGRFRLVPVVLFYLVDIPYFFIVLNYLLPYATKSPYRIPKMIVTALGAFFFFWIGQQLADIGAALFQNASIPQANWKNIGRPFWRWAYLSGISTAVYFARDGLRKIKRTHDLQLRNMQLETAWLRSRIKPHLVFNSLQFIYDQVIDISENAAETVILLSDVMHYALADQATNVQLGEEIEQAEKYIALNRARLKQQLCFDTDISIDVASIKYPFPQLIIINIVENMFRYGQLDRPDSPGKLRIVCANRRFYLHSRNLIANTDKAASTGIGLLYIRDRLQSGFDGKYQIHVTEDNHYYDLKLTIML